MQTEFTPAETSKFQTQLMEIQAKTKSVVIVSHEDVEKANMVLRDIKAFQKDIEDNRTALTKPMNDTVKQINAMAKQYYTPAEELEKEVKTKILGFNELEETRRRERENAVAHRIKLINQCNSTAELSMIPIDPGEDPRINVARMERHRAILKKIREGAKPSVEMEKERIAEDNKIAEAKQQVQETPEPEKIKGVREIKVVKVIDETLVPRAYMTPDLKKIEEALKNGVIIPGVNYETQKIFATQR